MESYSKRFQYFESRQKRGLDVGPEPFLKWVLDQDSVNVRRTRSATTYTVMVRYGMRNTFIGAAILSLSSFSYIVISSPFDPYSDKGSS